MEGIGTPVDVSSSSSSMVRNSTYSVSRCLSHVVNLADVDVMDHITKIAAVQTTNAIWEYDPSLAGNRVLGGSLDVIAAIRTLAVKVSTY